MNHQFPSLQVLCLKVHRKKPMSTEIVASVWDKQSLIIKIWRWQAAKVLYKLQEKRQHSTLQKARMVLVA